VAAGLGLALLVGADGTPAWQVTRVALVLAVSALVLRATDHSAAALGVLGYGAVVTAVGIGLVPHVVKAGPGIGSIASVTMVCGGLTLVASSLVDLLAGRRRALQVGGGLGAVLAIGLAAFVVGPSVAATNVPATEVGASPASRDLTFESVTFTTSDGVMIAAWYVPSGNGAAVVLRHGAGSTRSDVLDEAAVLARHGYGVLLTDARGHGDSGGRAMDFGWYGDVDITAATDHLAARPDVDPHRIGVVGMSMGGEEAIGAAGADPRLRAVVVEGATARTASDKAWLSDAYGMRGFVQEQVERLQYALTDLLTEAGAPASLHDAVGRSDARFLLVTAGDVADEAEAAEHIASAAPDRVVVWTVTGAPHTGGLGTSPEEWERRVVQFLDEHLGPEPSSSQ
jgi:dienelactone hydrolase